MKPISFSCAALACLVSAIAVQAYGQTAAGIPHLQKQGTATQLVVDGKPFLALTGELGNNTASSLENMQPLWSRLVAGNLNCVLAAVSWAQLEPEEGHFDFALVDGLIQEARRNHLKLMFLWFGSWKNGLSSYPPLWVKQDYKRFPRIKIKGGKSIELLSTFGDASRDADARAFRALMRHIREMDGQQYRVDDAGGERSGRAARFARPVGSGQQGFCRPVPKELMDYLQKHKDTLAPELREVWSANGFKDFGHVGRSIRPGQARQRRDAHPDQQPAAEPGRISRPAGASCTGRWTNSSWPGTTPGTSARW